MSQFFWNHNFSCPNAARTHYLRIVHDARTHARHLDTLGSCRSQKSTLPVVLGHQPSPSISRHITQVTADPLSWEPGSWLLQTSQALMQLHNQVGGEFWSGETRGWKLVPGDERENHNTDLFYFSWTAMDYWSGVLSVYLVFGGMCTAENRHFIMSIVTSN